MKKRKKRSVKASRAASLKGHRTRAKMLKARAKNKKKKVQQRPRPRTRSRKRKDPNIVYPGKDPAFVFPEEGTDAPEARAATPQEQAIVKFGNG